MDDYIPKDAIINSPHKYYAPAGGVAKNDGYNPSDWAIQIDKVMEIPAADVAPVVRCADCKWFQCNMRQDGYLPDGVPEFECRYWCGPCDPTDYCSYGEV